MGRAGRPAGSSIAFKAELLLKYLDQTYRIDQGLKNGAAADVDELVLVCQVSSGAAAASVAPSP